MNTVIVVKMEGRDVNGNTGPLNPRGDRDENIYPFNGVSITYLNPEGVHALRKMTFDPVSGEPVFEKTIDEVVLAHAEELADGREYFITTKDRLPDHYFKPAWRYGENEIFIDMEIAKLVQKDVIAGCLRKKLIELSDPILSLKPETQAEKIKLLADFEAVDLSKAETPEELKAINPYI